jgi:hypothetical protein
MANQEQARSKVTVCTESGSPIGLHDLLCLRDTHLLWGTSLAQNPFATGTTVSPPTNVALSPFTDQYFRGFDPAFPDYYRFTEWKRDFDAN